MKLRTATLLISLTVSLKTPSLALPVMPQNSGSTNPVVDARLSLAELRIRQEKFDAAIAEIRSVLLSSPSEELEIESTFLLGKALLLSGQATLAEEALKHLQENWPDHSRTKEARFLAVELKLQGMTGIASFAHSLRQILDFEPFSVDLDFFRYFIGYTGGYTFELYNPIHAELKKWFEHHDVDLSTRALLLDGLTRTLSLGDMSGQESLREILKTNHLFHRHLASFALILMAAKNHPDQPDLIARNIPEDWQETETGQLCKLLLFHLQAWVVGDFQSALLTLSELDKNSSTKIRQVLPRHKKLLDQLIQPTKSHEQRFQLALSLKSYGAIWFAREHFELLIQDLRPGILKARAEYELGRLFMDDLKDEDQARQWLKEARRGLLPQEYKDEIEWRLIRLMQPEMRQKAITRLAGLDEGFAEAAIQAELKRGSLSQALIDKYWKALQRMNPDAASRKEILITLAILAEEAHQYPKARFFLEELARHDLARAQKMLDQNLFRQDLFEARLQQNLSPEPERWRYEQGRVLHLLGRSTEARAIFESIESRKSVYAEKARMALLKMELGPQPYSRGQMNQLRELMQENPDPAVQSEAAKLWFQSASTLLSGYPDLVESRRKELDAWLSDDVIKLARRLLKKLKISTSGNEESARQAALAVHAMEDKNLAHELLNALPDSPSSVETLKLKLQFALSLEKTAEAIQLGEALAQLVRPDEAGAYLVQNLKLKLMPKDSEERPKMSAVLQAAESYCKLRIDACGPLIARALLIPSPEGFEDTDFAEMLESSKLLSEHGTATLAERLAQFVQANPESSYSIAIADLALRILEKRATAAHETTILRLMRLGGSLELGLSALCNIAKGLGSDPENMSQTRFLRELLADALESKKLNLEGERGLEILDFLWKALPEEQQIMALKALGGADADSLRDLKQIDVWLKQDNWNMASQRIHKILNLSRVPDVLKYKALELAHSHLENHRQRKIQDFRNWLFKIDSRNLPPRHQKQHQQWIRSINAEAVVASLRKDLNWDDPQNPRNIRILFQIAETYLMDLKDVPKAMDLLNQIRETFRDPKTRKELEARQQDLVLLDKVYLLQKENILASRVRAADILLEDLKRPTEALDMLADAEELALNQADRDMIFMERARIHIHRRDPDAAEAELNNLSAEYSGFTASTLRQIEASRELAKLPSLAQANAGDRIAIARIHLYSFMDLKEAERVIQPLENNRLNQDERNALALLKADFYNTAMGRNQPSLAMDYLKSGIANQPNATILARLESMAGFHAYTYDLNPYLAKRHFQNSYEAMPDSPWGRLSALHLADLAEQSGNGGEALSWLKRLQDVSSLSARTTELEPRETALRKSLLMQKMQEHLKKLGPEDRHLVLESARALAVNPDYADEAHSKYRLFLRLENDPKTLLQVREELARFHQKNARLKEALAEWRHIFDEENDSKTRLNAALMALNILGEEMQNWSSAIALARQASELLLPQEDLKPVRERLSAYRKAQASQKKVTLRNLGFSHFEEIKTIKDDFYSRGDWEGAARAYKKLLKQTRNFQLEVGVHYELSRILDLKLKQYEEALRHYQSFRSYTSDPEVGAEILLRIAEIYMNELRKPDEAFKSYQTFIQDYPASRRLVAVQFELARLLAGPRMEYSSALDVYTDIANAYPQTDYEQKALFARAQLESERLSDYNSAIATYQEIIDRYFDSQIAAQSQFQIARLYEVELNREQEAINTYLDLIDRWPNSDLATQARRQIDKIRNR